MTVGIYKLVFSGTDKVYIGQSSILENRLNQHINKLKLGTHSIKMNSAYKEFGEPTLEVLCECTVAELNDFENETIEIYNAVDNGFNTLYNAGDFPINYGEDCANAKYSNVQIIEAFKYLLNNSNVSLYNASVALNMSYIVIRHLACGTSHNWLELEFKNEYKQLMLRNGNRKTAKSASEQGKSYPLISSPTKEIFNITNIRKFARDNNLNAGALGQVLRGKKPHHKGWKLCPEEQVS